MVSGENHGWIAQDDFGKIPHDLGFYKGPEARWFPEEAAVRVGRPHGNCCSFRLGKWWISEGMCLNWADQCGIHEVHDLWWHIDWSNLFQSCFFIFLKVWLDLGNFERTRAYEFSSRLPTGGPYSLTLWEEKKLRPQDSAENSKKNVLWYGLSKVMGVPNSWMVYREKSNMNHAFGFRDLIELESKFLKFCASLIVQNDDVLDWRGNCIILIHLISFRESWELANNDQEKMALWQMKRAFSESSLGPRFAWCRLLCHWLTGWWFGTFFIFPYIGNNHPNWLIFFRGVQTTNQLMMMNTWNGGFPKSWAYPNSWLVLVQGKSHRSIAGW